MSLLYTGQQITIYGGLFLVIIGVIGNGINILLFSSVRNYRTTPCTFYFLIGSIDSILYLLINLISRIVSVGFGTDLTRTSVSWCKIREFSVITLSIITLSCSCLATIDQFFGTCQSAYLRRFSNIKWSHRIVIIMMIIWCLHGTPIFFFYNISPITNTCVNTNRAYSVYITIYLLGLLCGIPVLLMVTFGYLTYRNIRLTRVLAEQQVDRQMTKMILIQVVLVIVCVLPYGVNSAYGLITSGINKDTNRLLDESLASTVFGLWSYLYYAGSCYMFLISSSRFRRATKDRIFFCLRPNQVIGVQQQNNKVNDINNIIIRQWNHLLDHSMEFRCFIYQSNLTAISQYSHYWKFYHLQNHFIVQQIKLTIIKYWEEKIKPLLSPFTEIGIIENKLSNQFECIVIEMNPFETSTGASLFHWTTDINQLAGQENDVEIRVRSDYIEGIEGYIEFILEVNNCNTKENNSSNVDDDNNNKEPYFIFLDIIKQPLFSESIFIL